MDEEVLESDLGFGTIPLAREETGTKVWAMERVRWAWVWDLKLNLCDMLSNGDS